VTTLPPSCADCLEIWEPQAPGTLYAYNGIALPFFIYGTVDVSQSMIATANKSQTHAQAL
jgi:hypothetical protein